MGPLIVHLMQEVGEGADRSESTAKTLFMQSAVT